MNDALKQRLVGALILIALGVIFWPLIFVPAKEGPAVSEASMPPRPVIDRSPIAVPDSQGFRGSPRIVDKLDATGPDDLSRTGSFGASQEIKDIPEQVVQTVTQPAAAQAIDTPSGNTGKAEPRPQATKEKKPRKTAPIAPTLDQDGIPIAWILQVASVSSAEKAEQLRERLLDMGHKAYTKRIDRDGRTLVRVAVGPRSEKVKLEAIKSDIDREFGVQSIIARYLP